MKRCSKCKQQKPEAAFYQYKSNRVHHWCIACEKAYHEHWRRTHASSVKRTNFYTKIKQAYGIDRATYDAMLIKQGYRCAVCRKPSTSLQVDHDHVTTKVRGLLCGGCNRGLAAFKEDAEALNNAIKYLASFPLATTNKQ